MSSAVPRAHLSFLALLALVFAPSSAALDDAEGELVVEHATLPRGAVVETADLHGFLWEGEGVLGNLTFTSPHVVACYVEKRWLVADIIGNPVRLRTLANKDACFPLTDVKAAVRSENVRGYVGFHSDGSFLTFTAAQDVRTTPMPPSALTDRRAEGAQVTGDAEAYNQAFFIEEVHENFLLVEGAGSLDLTGSGALILRGPYVTLTAKENRTGYATGDYAEGASEEVAAWLYLRFEEASFAFESPGSMKVALGRTQASVDGTLRLAARTGVLHTPDATYRPAAGKQEMVNGLLAVTLEPAATPAEALLHLEGSIRSTSMTASAVAAPLPVVGTSRLAFMLIVGVAVAIGSCAALPFAHALRKQRRERVKDLEYFEVSMVHALELARDDPSRYQDVLRFATQALELRPGSSWYAAHAGLALAHLGRVDEALLRWEEAHASAPAGDGTVALEAAFFLRDKGYPLSLVRAWCEKAVTKDPHELFTVDEHLPEVALDPEWEPVRERALADVARDERAKP